jgi:hypothetical protein
MDLDRARRTVDASEITNVATIDRWSVRQSEIGGLDFLEMREAQTIFRFIPPGSQVDVSIDGGHAWRFSASPARSIVEAEAFGRAVARSWREECARRRTRRPHQQTMRAAVGQARARTARSARGEDGGHVIAFRDWRDPAPSGFAFDAPEAIALARMNLDTYRASVEKQNGSGDLFAVAVALVRGYGLLPDTYGGILLAEFNKTAEPPWRDRDLRRALVNAEAFGRMPWGVLYFRDLARLNRGGVRGGVKNREGQS